MVYCAFLVEHRDTNGASLMTDQPPEKFRAWVTQDWQVNAPRRDSGLVLAWFRLAQWSRPRWGLLGTIIGELYHLFCVVFLAIELRPETEVGPNMWFPHPYNIVIHSNVRIGSSCMIRHGVTIGNTAGMDGGDTAVPVIGDHVEMGPGCVVVGGIHIGDGARIAANAFVGSDVPAGAMAIGNPARILRAETSE